MQCAGLELDSNIGGDFAVRRTFSTVSTQSGRAGQLAQRPSPTASPVVIGTTGPQHGPVERSDTAASFVDTTAKIKLAWPLEPRRRRVTCAFNLADEERRSARQRHERSATGHPGEVRDTPILFRSRSCIVTAALTTRSEATAMLQTGGGAVLYQAKTYDPCH